MSELASPPHDPKSDHGFFGQPFALANLFSVELWERFSFYGMQGILIYYLYYSTADGGLGISEASAVSIVGAYGGTVYLSTVLGAWIADRVLGSERTLFYSAVLVMLGHIGLAAIPGLPGVGVGLILIAVGSGGLKANATSLVGDLYSEGDERRDAGFSLYYMGINIGAFIGPLLTGWAQENWGFHVGFALAAVGMALGLIQYALGRKHLGNIGSAPANPLPGSMLWKYWVGAAAAVVVVVVLCLVGVVTTDNLSDVVVALTIVAAVGYFGLILSSRQITSTERSRVVAFIPMFLASAAFWSLFQQQFTVVPIYADKFLDRNLFGWDFPPSWVQSINPVFIIVFSGVFAAMWTKLGPRQPSSPMKFAIGTGLMGLAFLAFLPFSNGEPNGTPLLALVFILLLFTFAELFLSPVGLSLSTKLAPKAFHTQMVALFFLSVALGSAMAGTLAKYYDTADQAPYFLWIGLASIGVGVVMVVLSPWISRMMRGVH
ncbi:peptide MFS transporter [Rhodococcus gannanensis]|uniref:Peptide MFS transporter n=1 Tax=Rhodococcus gannanensis TaxID=1960308 RepID=A0ABW4P9Z2_9NOCA